MDRSPDREFRQPGPSHVRAQRSEDRAATFAHASAIRSRTPLRLDSSMSRTSTSRRQRLGTLLTAPGNTSQTPTVPTVAFGAEGPLPFEVEGEPVKTAGGGIAFTYPFNFSGNPAVSLRAGLSDDRLPVGLQLVAPRLREDLLLQVAHQYEARRPWRTQWPQL